MADNTTSAQQASGTVETKAETTKSPSEFAKFWLQAIQLASDDESEWRDDGEDCLKRYAKGKKSGFNILYANTQTTVPALYNSEPSPDVRRRFDIAKPTQPQAPQQQPGMPPDPGVQQAMMAYQQAVAASQKKQDDSKQVCTAIERALSVQSERYNFDGAMQAAVRDRQLPGRGVTRVRVKIGPSGTKWVECEPVQWDDFRHGPGKTFADWPWVSFQHKLTREELVKLNAAVGKVVKLDAAVGDTPPKKGDTLPDSFKRAVCWEVWDKETRQVYWFAESFQDGPLKVDEDPYELRDFLPIPEPLYQVKRTNTTTPVCEFTLWKKLADEMDQITTRIIGLIKVMKAKGLYDGSYAAIVEKLKSLDDGELAAADDAGRSMANGGIDKAIWMWPIETIAKVVEALYVARDQAKQAIFEFTGVSDIQRGETDPNETLGAQQIKAQWGSLRLQEAQRDVQRYARDLYRLMADLMAYAWEDKASWAAVTDIMLTDDQLKMLRNDAQREFAIEIETDSTIRADLTRAQQNITGFVTGLGSFMESVAPAVQAGFMPPEMAVRYVGAFARVFKLGREAEDLTEEWVKWLEEKAKNPQPPQKDPKVEAEEVKAQAQMQKAQADVQMVQVKAKAEQDKTQMDLQAKQAEFQLRMQELQAELQMMQQELGIKQQELGMKRQEQAGDMALAERQQQLDAQAQQRDAQAAEHGRGLRMEVMDAQAKAKQQAAQRQGNGGARG